MTITDEYLQYQQQFEKKYGPRTIVLMEVGSFFEIYGVDNEEHQLGRAQEIADLLDIQLSRKNKSIVRNSIKNPLMAGVPSHAIAKYLQILLHHNYIVVMIEQLQPGPKADRKVTKIYSPGTDIEYVQSTDSKLLACIYLENAGRGTNSHTRPATCIGVSIIDLSTGENTVRELFDSSVDDSLAMDQLYQVLHLQAPREIVFYLDDSIGMTDKQLASYLEVNESAVHYRRHLPKEYTKLSYQTQFLGQVFPDTGLLSVIEYLDLEKHPYGLLSYLLLLQFTHEHNEEMLQRLPRPTIWRDVGQLSLTHNSASQLNVIPDSLGRQSGRFQSLFHVVNKTSTAIGRRLLKQRLLYPITDPIELQIRYQSVQELMQICPDDPEELPESPSWLPTSSHSKKEQFWYQALEGSLNQIMDLERLHRKLSLRTLQPADFALLDESYRQVASLLYLLLHNKNLPTVAKLLPIAQVRQKFTQFMAQYNSELNLEIIIKFHYNNISANFFQPGVDPDLDHIQSEIQDIEDFFRSLKQILSDLLEADSNFVKSEHNDRDGHHFSLTHKRHLALKAYFSSNPEPVMVSVSSQHPIQIDPTSFRYRSNPTAKSVKIFSEQIQHYSVKWNQLLEDLKQRCGKLYQEKLDLYHQQYGSVLQGIANFVGRLDFIKSAARTATEYGYCRPDIISPRSQVGFCDSPASDFGQIEALQIRHPIIERIQIDIPYVPNDIHLGDESQKGILLYGVNACGKSSLMKTVGLAVILAQAGLFVPAKQFRFYPYRAIFTRIYNNDNLFKSQSSFAVEISELRAILKRADSHSLVLGDELCSGTESVSALSIVAAGVVTLSKLGTSFIFATHLHQLSEIPQVQQLSNVENYHLKVIHDPERQQLIYDRRLELGSGSSIYGLEVCKAMDLDTNFLNLANQLRQQIMNVPQHVLDPKTSIYNSQVYVHRCEICDQEGQEVHHIRFQCLANKQNRIEHYHKNVKSNLVVLCSQCHKKVHQDRIKISGWVATTQGIQLSYQHQFSREGDEEEGESRATARGIPSPGKRRGKKYSPTQIETLLELKELPGISQKRACQLAKNKYQIEISPATLSKLWHETPASPSLEYS